MTKNPKAIAYYRVSTVKQGESGLGLEAQQHDVNKFAELHRYEVLQEYVEVESGKKDENRPQLQAALAHCKRTRATLIIAKLDRLSRNNAFLAMIIEKAVDVKAVDMPGADRTMLQIRAVFAELEARQISKRTSDALQALIRKGVKLGPKNRKIWLENIEAGIAFAVSIQPLIKDLQSKGYKSTRRLTAKLNEDKVPTSTGTGKWHQTTVVRVLGYYKLLQGQKTNL